MRSTPNLLALLSVLAVALLAPVGGATAAKRDGARVFAEREALPHGIAADRDLVFVAEPGVGPATTGRRIVVLDRRDGRQIGTLPAPGSGFRMPFTLRVKSPGRLVALDNAGFPPSGPPTVYDYRYRGNSRRSFGAQLVRTTSFGQLPLLFAEDLEVLPNGEYVVSESIRGGLWLIDRRGQVRPGIVPSGTAPLPQLAPCASGPDDGIPSEVGGVPFAIPGGLLPGAGSLAVRGRNLYLSSTCAGGIQRVPIATLLDRSRPVEERAREIVTVAPRRYPLESLKGIQFDPSKPDDPWIYAGDPFRLQLIRVHSATGARETLSTRSRLFDFTVATTFLPPRRRGRPSTLLTASDQEYRWSGLNPALTSDRFRVPFVLAEYQQRRHR